MADAALQTVIARAEIGNLIAEYARIIDWLDWDRLDAVFWPETVFDFGMFKGDFAAYRGFVADLESGYARRLHMFTLPSIAVSGQAAQVDVGCIIACRTDSPPPSVDETFWGRYLLTAEQRGEEWRLSGLTYVMNLYERVERQADDRGGPMHMGDDLTTAHPFARR